MFIITALALYIIQIFVFFGIWLLFGLFINIILKKKKDSIYGKLFATDKRIFLVMAAFYVCSMLAAGLLGNYAGRLLGHHVDLYSNGAYVILAILAFAGAKKKISSYIHKFHARQSK